MHTSSIYIYQTDLESFVFFRESSKASSSFQRVSYFKFVFIFQLDTYQPILYKSVFI